MPFEFRVEVTVGDAMKALDRLDDPGLPGRIAERVADEVVLPALIRYPKASGAKQPFVSSKQRKFVMAAIRKGQITVPYRRSGDLGTKWAKQPFNGGMVLQSQVGYSEIVIGDKKQGDYFKGTWPTLSKTIGGLEGDIALAATAEIVETIGNAGP